MIAERPAKNRPGRLPRALAAAALLAAALASGARAGDDSPALRADVRPAGTPPIGVADANLVPNAAFHGSAGVVGASGAVVTGTVPTRWRGFAVNGGDIDFALEPLAANALFPGSAPTTAVRMTVAAFGTDQGFDHFNAYFQIVAGRRHAGEVWLRTGNPDQTPQQVSVSLPLFAGQPPVFTGRDPGAFGATATSTWTRFAGPHFTEAGDVLAHLAFRLIDDGGQDSLLIALPTVLGAPVGNDVPNPGFTGSGGASVGAVTGGPVPTGWRAFAVGAGQLQVGQVPIAANALYPGSQATTAMRLNAINADSGPGLDHTSNRIPLLPGFPYWSEVWLRSGNADQSPQALTAALPIFDSQGFTGRQPGLLLATVGPAWSLYAGPMFTEVAGMSTFLAFRPTADGGEDIIEIALPRVVGPSTDPLFQHRFELPPPP
jgi:hypothetical protein